ncbi:MAG: TlpA family protein disulfide reductase [Pseudobacter sp.]|uniref:TlpA family protein disulfide reductase n=1 Tax=Pseudobacter sp. TaxID=2045420 RepID=UPI003F81955B
MKRLFVGIIMLFSLSLFAQQKKPANPKLAALKNEKNQTVLQKKIKALENGTVEDLELLIQYYGKDEKKKDAVTKILLKKYPHTDNARMLRMMSFIKINGAENVEAHLQSLVKAYPGVNLDMEKSMVSSYYAEVPNAEKVIEYIHLMEDPVFKVGALTMAIGYMAPVDKTAALEIMTQELPMAQKIEALKAPSGPFKLDPRSTYFDYINLYGKLLFKAGKNEEAYKYTAEAYNNVKNRDAELTLNYAFLSSSLEGKYEYALPVLANAVQAGKFEQRYIDEVRKAYTKLNPGKDVDAYIAELQSDFIGKIKAEIAPKMINEDSPAFAVKDIDGKTVSLADFKGKTIILDFWATWCGPCVESFPAMQMAVNRYVNDPDVKFLFIHTWDNVPDPLTDAKNFLSARNYNFALYMDKVDPATKAPPAATLMKVDGIPAKFIIDGNGKIRFKASGFSGSPEAAAEEVVQMVEMARKGA